MKLHSKLIKGSIVLLIMLNAFSFLNFMFQFGMARLLTIAQYSILATLVSIVYIMNVLTESIQLLVTKYVSSEHEEGKIKNILRTFLNSSMRLATIIFVGYLILVVPLSILLKIPYLLLALNSLMIFLACILPITRGALQGQKMFKHLGLNMIVEASVKLLVAIGLVILGYGVYGAVGATIIGAIAAVLISLMSLKNIRIAEEKKVDINLERSYSIPVFVIISSIVAIYSLDIIVAKIVFNEQVAGIYAVASILAKIIVWGTIPISKAMFPLSVESNAKNKDSGEILLNSFGLLVALIVIALGLFYLFPDLIVRIFSGKILPESAEILFYLGIGTSVISLANLNLMYKISKGETKGSYILPAFVILEVLLLMYFSKSLVQFSFAFITSSVAFLWASISIVKK